MADETFWLKKLKFTYLGNSIPNQHAKMTSPSDLNQTWVTCTPWWSYCVV